MKLLKKAVATALAMLMLTACSGGGGGGAGGGTPVAPVTPSAFSNTKTYKTAQSGKGKNLYAEYYGAENNKGGTLVSDKSLLTKQGTLNGNFYADLYDGNDLYMTYIDNQGNGGVVVYCNDGGKGPYSEYAEVAKKGGAKNIDGKNIWIDAQAIFGSPDKVEANKDVAEEMSKLDASKMDASVGTYTIPGTTQKYYAEIFTLKADPAWSQTYAYDDNDELKAIVTVDHDDIEGLFFNKFEFDSSMFNAAKLNKTGYNATDVTTEYLAGLKK